MSLPLTDVGEGFSNVVHFLHREPKEPHFSRFFEAVVPKDHNRPSTLHHRVDSPRMGSSRQLAVPPSLQHKPFTDAVLYEISPPDVCDVLLGQPYLWKRNVVYESRPRTAIITLGNKLYKILEVAMPTPSLRYFIKNAITPSPVP